MIDLEKIQKHGIGILNSSFSGRYSTHQSSDKYSDDLWTIKVWWANQRVPAFRGALELCHLNTLDLTHFLWNEPFLMHLKNKKYYFYTEIN